jgi:hypothetical protein
MAARIPTGIYFFGGSQPTFSTGFIQTDAPNFSAHRLFKRYFGLQELLQSDFCCSSSRWGFVIYSGKGVRTPTAIGGSADMFRTQPIGDLPEHADRALMGYGPPPEDRKL